MAIKAFKRFEKKFIITKDQYDRLLPILSDYMNLDKYCKLGENYNIYNNNFWKTYVAYSYFMIYYKLNIINK